MNQVYSKKPAYVALISVLIVGLVGVTIAVSSMLRGIAITKSAISLDHSGLAKAYANSCADEALERIHKDSTYTSTDSISFDTDSCSYTITNTGGDTRQIDAEATASTTTRNVQVILSDIDPIAITSWQEVE